MKCTDCGYELTSIYAARSVELQWDGERWIEKNVFSQSFSCPNCNGELSDGEIDELGVHVYEPYR